MICEKCGETLQQDAKICEKCGASIAKPSDTILQSGPRFSWIHTLLAGVAAIVVCLYIAAAIYYLNDGVGEQSITSAKSSVSEKKQKPKVDVPSVAPSNVKPIAKEPPVASIKQNEAKPTYQEDVQSLINKWLAGWQSGNMETYRSCYAPDFQSKGMNLDAWITNKINVRNKSGNISISVADVKISADENTATAVFTQHYSSSKSKDSGKKTLELKKINSEWKIYKEIM